MPPPVHLLLTFDFPPMRGGIARYMAEMTRRYPPGRLVVSTGTVEGAAAADASMPNPVDRVRVEAQQLRTAVGLLRWSRRARALARSSGAAFSWCGNIRPAAYPADWVRRREGVPYGIIFHGSDVLKLRLKLRGAPVKRGIYRRLFANAAVLAPNSAWTRDQCLGALDDLGVQYPADRVRYVP